MKTLTELAADDPRLVFVTGDLGFGVVESFAESFPNQFLNAGVAEQNLTGLAAGLAMAGCRVFTYSIANFPLVRCLEQVRNDVCYHDANVTIVSIGGGLAYGALGYSHHAVEDLAIARALPNLTVVAPGDPVEAELATRALASHDGPAYLRLGKAGEPVCHERPPEFELGRAITLRDGDDVTLISTGAMLRTALDVSARLADTGVDAGVVSMHTVKPLDRAAVAAAGQRTGRLVTLEEHSLSGGLGSAVAEAVVDEESPARLLRLGLPVDGAVHAVGTQEYLRQRYGLDIGGVVSAVSSFVQRP